MQPLFTKRGCESKTSIEHIFGPNQAGGIQQTKMNIKNIKSNNATMTISVTVTTSLYTDNRNYNNAQWKSQSSTHDPWKPQWIIWHSNTFYIIYPSGAKTNWIHVFMVPLWNQLSTHSDSFMRHSALFLGTACVSETWFLIYGWQWCMYKQFLHKRLNRWQRKMRMGIVKLTTTVAMQMHHHTTST